MRMTFQKGSTRKRFPLLLTLAKRNNAQTASCQGAVKRRGLNRLRGQMAEQLTLRFIEFGVETGFIHAHQAHACI